MQQTLTASLDELRAAYTVVWADLRDIRERARVYRDECERAFRAAPAGQRQGANQAWRIATENYLRLDQTLRHVAGLGATIGAAVAEEGGHDGQG